MVTLSQSCQKLCPLTPNTRGKWTHLLIYLFLFCSFIPKIAFLQEDIQGNICYITCISTLHQVFISMKTMLPKVLLHLTEIDVKTCFDVKTVSQNENQTARVICSGYNEPQSTTKMVQVHWIQIDLKWTKLHKIWRQLHQQLFKTKTLTGLNSHKV